MAEQTQQIDTTSGSNIPQEKGLRERMRAAARTYVAETDLRPPFSADELLTRSERLIRACGFDESYAKYIAILLSNAAWEEGVADIPFNRRVLFLPQCIRDTDRCEAASDEIGLICSNCGGCDIGKLQSRAEELGYSVLVAEGTSVVTRMLLAGEIDAVIGVSCLSVLEKAFPYMAAGAIPGLAFPLLQDGCNATGLDGDQILEAINLSTATLKRAAAINVDELRDQVAAWFEIDALHELLDLDNTTTEEIGISWLARGGKRWRPLLAASAFEVLTGIVPAGDPHIRRIAIAVECFHKASLIHDDIEDDDEVRYGQPTLHVQHGIPVALNAGDYLLGEGYRLIADCGVTPQDISRMLAVAAKGHRDLSLGQGDELCWTHDPGPLTTQRVIEIFRRKTAPAFEVALCLGAICGGADNVQCAILTRFSENLGIAYQIQDDLDDYCTEEQQTDIDAMRPSLLVAMCYEAADHELRGRMEAAWCTHKSFNGLSHTLREAIDNGGITETATDALVRYRDKALKELRSLRNPGLKQLLNRLAGRIVSVD